jgi:mannonate dehydratase
MKITQGEVLVTSPGRNFVTLRLRTDEGVYGLGDATLNGRELAVVSYLSDHVVPCLIGRDPSGIEDIWQLLYRGAYWRRGPVTMTAIAAVDMALWDIKGKCLNTPVYNLLGGRSRDGVLVYGHASGGSVGEAADDVGRYLDRGYRAVRAQAAVPTMSASYGVGSGGAGYEPAHRGLPLEDRWATEKYMAFVPRLFEAIRDQYGGDVHLLHDAHHRLTPIQAARVGRDLEPHRLFWLEDAVPAEQQEALATVRRHTTTPLAIGEVFNTIHDVTTLIRDYLIDYIRMSVTHSGGITHLRQVAAYADVHQVRTGCHGATDLSPVSLAAALHFDISVPNFGIQEYMGHSTETNETFPHQYFFDDGYLHPGDAPGLGVDYDEAVADRFPYQRAYLPLTRLEDGTMFNWLPTAGW